MKGIFTDGFINIILVSGITQLKTSGIALDYNILYGPLSEKEEQITEDRSAGKSPGRVRGGMRIAL